MRNTADELEALLKVLDEAGADMFVEEAAQALSLHDYIDLARRYQRIQKQAEAARRPSERTPSPATIRKAS